MENSKFAQALLRRREEAAKKATQTSISVSQISEKSIISVEEQSIDPDIEVSMVVDEDQELFQLQRENQDLKAKIRELMQQNKVLSQKIDDLLDQSEIEILTEQVSNLQIELTNEKNLKKQAEDRLLYLQYQYDIKCKEAAANMKILESLQLKNRKLQEQNSSLSQINASQLESDQYSNGSRRSRLSNGQMPDSPRRYQPEPNYQQNYQQPPDSPKRYQPEPNYQQNYQPPESPKRFQAEPSSPRRYQEELPPPSRIQQDLPNPSMYQDNIPQNQPRYAPNSARSSNSSSNSRNPADMEYDDLIRERDMLEDKKIELENIMDENFDDVDPNISNQYNRVLTRLSQVKRELRFRS